MTSALAALTNTDDNTLSLDADDFGPLLPSETSNVMLPQPPKPANPAPVQPSKTVCSIHTMPHLIYELPPSKSEDWMTAVPSRKDKPSLNYGNGTLHPTRSHQTKCRRVSQVSANQVRLWRMQTLTGSKDLEIQCQTGNQHWQQLSN